MAASAINKRKAGLEERFRELLYEIDPSIQDSPEFAEEFASRLASFTEAWANDSQNLLKLQEELEEWIDSAKAGSSGAARSPCITQGVFRKHDDEYDQDCG